MQDNDKAIIIHTPQLPANTIDGYIHYVNSIPVLSREEEAELANQWISNQDIKAAQKLVLSHLRYVVRVAKSYMGYGLNLADLIQEGSIGLMKAVKKFKPEREVRLVTFAMHWIKAEIHEFIIRNWRIVKIATTKPQRKLFFKLRSKKQSEGWLSSSEITEIAKDLGVKEKEVIQMEARMSYGDTPFDLPDDIDDANDRLSYAPVEYLEHKSAAPDEVLETESWNNQMHSGLQEAFNNLDDRAKYILQQRWLNHDSKATLDDLAQHFSVSKERIRQIEAKAMAQIKNHLTADETI
jgi:RNA polymerase sigma-32 factor